MNNTFKKNTLVFKEELVKTFSRKQAYEAKEQYVRCVKHYEVKNCKDEEVISGRPNIFKIKSIPSKQQLIKWSTELAGIRRVAAGQYYINCDIGNLTYEDITSLSALHNVVMLSRSVCQEINWFNSAKLMPRNVEKLPLEDGISKFKKLIWESQAYQDLPQLGMSPNTLAEVTCKRLLTSDHMMFFSSLITKSQSNAHVVYINYISDIPKYLQRINNMQSNIKRIIFLINVGKNGNETFVGSDQEPGNHWSLAFCDRIDMEIWYCESLGWEIPKALIPKINQFIEILFGSSTASVFHCHNPAAHMFGSKTCTGLCSSNFPLQTCGSRKIERNCTATLKTKELENGSINVEAHHTHYGHKIQLQHLSISSRKKSEIAAKLHLGVTPDKILDDVRDNVGISIERIHLIEKKDINSLARTFGISRVQRHEHDQDSVAAWIEEWKHKEHSPLLFHKLQGEEMNDFKAEDFMIVLQTEFQASLLQEFGGNGVCMDSTHGTNMYDFSLTTIMVIDEFGQGQPAGWFLSNCETFEFLQLFFSKIRDASGRITPAWIMTDMALQFYDAFCKVNNCNPKRLWCYWHVDWAWQEELRSKDANKTVQAEVYEKLHFLRDVPDKNVFEDYMDDFLNSLKLSAISASFGEYFERFWALKKALWAYCYRIGTGINTNMLIEAFHRVLKYNYMQGKHNRRVDVCLFTLLKYNRDKIFDRYIKQTKGKFGYKQGLIYQRHKASEAMSSESVTRPAQNDRKWNVKSENSDITYDIFEGEEPCKEKCHFQCPECAACQHSYTCTCMDYLTNNIPCKHIHLVKRVLNTTEEDPENVADNYQEQDDDQDLEKTLRLIRGPEPLEVDILKEKVISHIMGLIERVRGSTVVYEEALQTLDKQINAASYTFTALMGNKQEILNAQKYINPNKDTVRQPKFYSTKKRGKN